MNYLKIAQQKYVNAIKQWVREDFPLWNTVPYWSAQANGVTGYLDKYSLCYSYGLWQLDDYCFVDCATGELVGWGSNGTYPAYNSFIVSLNIDKLDAKSVLDSLKAHASKPQSKHIGAPSNTLLEAKKAPIKYIREKPVVPAGFDYY